MHTTSPSLLLRLRDADSAGAWGRFVELYTPLLYYWARGFGLQDADAADLVQEVFVTLFRKLPSYRASPGKRFRGWLWTVVANKHRDRLRLRSESGSAGADLDDLPDPHPADSLEDAEYRAYLVGRVLQLMQSDFEPTTWRACWEVVVADRPAAEVAANLGLTVNAVYLAKARVLRRLRDELGDLTDS